MSRPNLILSPPAASFADAIRTAGIAVVTDSTSGMTALALSSTRRAMQKAYGEELTEVFERMCENALTRHFSAVSIGHRLGIYGIDDLGLDGRDVIETVTRACLKHDDIRLHRLLTDRFVDPAIARLINADGKKKDLRKAVEEDFGPETIDLIDKMKPTFDKLHLDKALRCELLAAAADEREIRVR